MKWRLHRRPLLSSLLALGMLRYFDALMIDESPVGVDRRRFAQGFSLEQVIEAACHRIGARVALSPAYEDP